MVRVINRRIILGPKKDHVRATKCQCFMCSTPRSIPLNIDGVIYFWEEVFWWDFEPKALLVLPNEQSREL